MNEGEEYLSQRDHMLVNCGMASKLISEKMTGVELTNNIDNTQLLPRFLLADLLPQERDYAQAVTVLEPLLDKDDDASALLLYATALRGLGRDDEAQQCMQQITEIDPMPESAIPNIIPALYATGRSDEALKLANSLASQWENYQLDSSGEEIPESCYTIATLFAQIGEMDKALEYLEKHFQHDDMPYDFGLMERDWRLDNVRDLPQYKTLIEKYKTIWKNNATTIKNPSKS
jgi:tetratricopeptide (TPR) repeat protein